MSKIVEYTNVKNNKDKFYFDFHSGVYSWDISHKDGLKNYRGSDGSRIQIMWTDEDPVMFHGW